MSAFAWQVVEQCNVMHYGKVEELVQLVTEVVPHLLRDSEKVDLLLGLRTKVRWTEAGDQWLFSSWRSRLYLIKADIPFICGFQTP